MKTEGHKGRPWEELQKSNTNKKSPKQRWAGSVLLPEQTCKGPLCLAHSKANLLITGSSAAQSCTCSCVIAPQLALQAWGKKKKNRSGQTAATQRSPPPLFLSSYLRTLSTSFNKSSTTKRLNLSLKSQLAACYTCHTTTYFHRSTWHTMRPSAYLRLHHRTLLYWCHWEKSSTLSLDFCPTSHRLHGARSLIFISLSSYTSSIMRLQFWQWIEMTSEFSELGELPEITRFHQQPERRPYHFFLKPTSMLCHSNNKFHGVPKVYWHHFRTGRDYYK